MTFTISNIIQYILALVFFFFLYSQVVTWVIEWYASMVNARGRFLRSKLRKWLGQGRQFNWYERVMDHAAVSALNEKESKTTEAIPQDVFADVITDLLIKQAYDIEVSQNTNGEFTRIEKLPDNFHINTDDERYDLMLFGLSRIENSDFKEILDTVFRNREKTYEGIHEGIKLHFSEYVSRVIIWYKENLRTYLIGVGFALAVLGNVNTIEISKRLWNDPVLTTQISATAEKLVNSYSSYDNIPRDTLEKILRKTSLDLNLYVLNPDFIQSLDSVNNHLNTLIRNQSGNLSKELDELIKKRGTLPIGWSLISANYQNWQQFFQAVRDACSEITFFTIIYSLSGWFLSALIASIGAPFWYDVLRKVTGYRNRRPQTEN